MGRPAARLTDMHTCPMASPTPHTGGPIFASGKPTVLIGGQPAARITDMLTCDGPPDVICQGSRSVYIGGLPAARKGDHTSHGGVIVAGCESVLIGDNSSDEEGDDGDDEMPPFFPFEGHVDDDPPFSLEMFTDFLNSSESMEKPRQQAWVLVYAGLFGTPFVDRCVKD